MDIAPLLLPVSPNAPSGPDFEDFEANGELSAELDLLETMTEGERKDGVTLPPRWSVIQERALELGKKGKHLRIATILTESACIVEGLGGLRDGLRLILEWCTGYWDTLQPALEREIGLSVLSAPRFLVKPRHIILANSLGGQFSYEDLEKARSNSNAEHGSEEANASRLVLAVFSDTKSSIHQANLTSAREALDHARAIEEIFDQRQGGDALNLADLRDLLSKMVRAIESFIPAEASPEAAPEGGGEAGAVAPAASAAPGVIHSRQSAVAALEKVIKYFEAAEPSSPVPFLLRRAQRCVGKDFMQLMEELGSQAEIILKSPTGLDGDENT